MDSLDVINLGIFLLLVSGLMLVITGAPRPPKLSNRSNLDRKQFDPAIVNNIERQIIPYIVSASMLPRTAEYTVFRFYSYTRALLAGIVGLGTAPPILKYLSQVATVGATERSTLSAPPGMGYTALTIAAVLVGFSVYCSRTNLDKRAVLADSCAAEFRTHYAKLLDIVTEPNCGKALDDLSNQIATNVQRHVAEESWTFKAIIAPGIGPRVSELTNEVLYCMTSSRNNTEKNDSSLLIQQKES